MSQSTGHSGIFCHRRGWRFWLLSGPFVLKNPCLICPINVSFMSRLSRFLRGPFDPFMAPLCCRFLYRSYRNQNCPPTEWIIVYSLCRQLSRHRNNHSADLLLHDALRPLSCFFGIIGYIPLVNSCESRFDRIEDSPDRCSIITD